MCHKVINSLIRSLCVCLFVFKFKSVSAFGLLYFGVLNHVLLDWPPNGHFKKTNRLADITKSSYFKCLTDILLVAAYITSRLNFDLLFYKM